MIQLGEIIDNRTLCDLFGVANIGGIRVNNGRGHIVLVSNNAHATYRNEWRNEELHFVGMGSVGPQSLSRQNRTLAGAAGRGYKIHLFEVFEAGQYVYAGEVELCGEPYLASQSDARADARSVWIFPLRKKRKAEGVTAHALDVPADYLPHGAYAVIRSVLTDDQRALVDHALDALREAGVSVCDQRDVDCQRYQRSLAQWHEGVLGRVRHKIKELIVGRRRVAKSNGKEFLLIDDELRINSASTETELRAALALLGYDDPALQEELFEDARCFMPMPDPPGHLTRAAQPELNRPKRSAGVDPSSLVDFT
ncbi:hypothetical protein E3H11_10535 [Bradyrhizobium brasilense]|uniref:hypothetical protein n=1 Tax=Bradyrhizobium brasilense TaxID=1419277 RepID=UPI0014564A21|nr:hypothetical protein [Bradyrhizobium brasilense]NLS69348.1 hypothetical protein [Bradyrhizobium brasilense]